MTVDISQSDISILTGCSCERLSELEQYGVVVPHDGKYTLADASRIQLAASLVDSGIPIMLLAQAIREASLSLDFASQLMFDPVFLSSIRLDEETAATGIDPERLNRMRSAAGLPRLAQDRALRQDDVELNGLLAAAIRLGVSDEGANRILRAFAQSTRRNVETMRDLFRREVEEPMLEAGFSFAAMLAAGAETRLELQRIGFRVLFLLQRRMLEEAVFDNIAARIQQGFHALGYDLGLPETMPAVAFADMSGFTQLTNQIGDIQAAEHAAILEELAQDTATGAGGSLVKPLGDGVMMLFPSALSGVEACMTLKDRTEKRHLLPLRAGIATGPIVQRDGDVFGHNVNLAARMTGVARPLQILACANTRDAIETARPGQLFFTALGPVSLKGIKDDVELFCLGNRAS